MKKEGRHAVFGHHRKPRAPDRVEPGGPGDDDDALVGLVLIAMFALMLAALAGSWVWVSLR
jgi:hypothetical protein